MDRTVRVTQRASPASLFGSVVAVIVLMISVGVLRAQLVPEPPLAQHEAKRQKNKRGDFEWMWQYGPPPEGGREHDLIMDPDFQPFLHQYFTAPQTFWGPQNGDPKDPNHKSLAETAYDFLSVPGSVIADQNRYLSVTGCVFHFCASRGLLFADLDGKHPLVAFAAIQWIKSSHTTSDPEAEYTLWIFPSQVPGTPQDPTHLPVPLVHSLSRWMKTPMAGSGIVQKVTAAILVDSDGTPHQIPVPMEGSK